MDHAIKLAAFNREGNPAVQKILLTCSALVPDQK